VAIEPFNAALVRCEKLITAGMLAGMGGNDELQATLFDRADAIARERDFPIGLRDHIGEAAADNVAFGRPVDLSTI
jgi:hypothetical protein